MAKVSDILVKLALDTSSLSRQIEATKSQLEGAFSKEAMKLSGNTGGLLANLAVGIGKVGMASVGMAGEMKANKVAFTQFMGSAEQAESMLANLSGFAANTPFELPGLMDTSKKMLNFQFAAQDIIPIMAAVGDSIAVVGGGQEAVNGVINALGQMQATGVASTETMNQLSAQGINGWGYLADSMGVSVAEAMARVQKGAVDSTTAINGVVLGMQTNFKGGMAAMSQEMPGLLDSIKSNVGTVMLEIGTRITEALDLKNKLQGAVTYLSSFASAVERAGVKSAILGLVPPEATAAIFAIGGALITVAIPAVIEFASAVALAVAPMLGYIAAGVALGVLAYEVWKNWEPLGELFSGLWDHIVSTAGFCLNNLQTNFFDAISSIMKLLTPLATLFGGALSTAVNDWANNAAAKVKELGTELQEINNKRTSSMNAMKQAAGKISLGEDSNILSIKEKVLPNTTFTGLSGTAVSAGAADNSAATRSVEEYQRLQEKAKQVSQSIEQAWAQTTQTQLQQLDVWKAEQVAALGETIKVNENYERDLLKIKEIYAARKKKLDEDEAGRIVQLKRSAEDIVTNNNNHSMSIGLTGVDKQVFDLKTGMTKEISDVTRRYENMVTEFAKLDASAKENNIKTWNDAKLGFEINADGTVDFTKQITQEKLVIQKDYLNQLQNLNYEQKKHEELLNQAYAEGDLSKYQELLNSKQEAQARQLEDRQRILDLYNTVKNDSEISVDEVVGRVGTEAYAGLKAGIADILTGTKSIGEVWQALGQTISNVIAKMAAEWIAAQLAMAIFGKAKDKTSDNASAKAASVAIAWAPAAAMVSLATFGENAGPAMLGIALTTGLAELLANTSGKATGGYISGPGTGKSDSILTWLSNGEYVIRASAVRDLGVGYLNRLNQGMLPAFAAGGLVAGPSLASVSRFRYDSAAAVVPKDVVAKAELAAGQEQRPADQYHITMQAWDGPSVDRWLESGGGAKITKFLKRQARSFVPVGV